MWAAATPAAPASNAGVDLVVQAAIHDVRVAAMPMMLLRAAMPEPAAWPRLQAWSGLLAWLDGLDLVGESGCRAEFALEQAQQEAGAEGERQHGLVRLAGLIRLAGLARRRPQACDTPARADGW
ncbi:hypothetical protein [Paractinoplanes hotanensis]|uniref:Uncharacterized protein n=1 Tax=Paractinoplanes hotanensis TaxID=2906497 RepID=A0ABT0YB81_9ACTN|nr:hypothetical protein [Actinoplanes hotanensis]MCM4083304.1 hypothetical protein [Actinoplanes hotanensis]